MCHIARPLGIFVVAGENSLKCELGGYRGRCECELVLVMNCVDFRKVVKMS